MRSELECGSGSVSSSRAPPVVPEVASSRAHVRARPCSFSDGGRSAQAPEASKDGCRFVGSVLYFSSLSSVSREIREHLMYEAVGGRTRPRQNTRATRYIPGARALTVRSGLVGWRAGLAGGLAWLAGGQAIDRCVSFSVATSTQARIPCSLPHSLPRRHGDGLSGQARSVLPEAPCPKRVVRSVSWSALGTP